MKSLTAIISFALCFGVKFHVRMCQFGIQVRDRSNEATHCVMVIKYRSKSSNF